MVLVVVANNDQQEQAISPSPIGTPDKGTACDAASLSSNNPAEEQQQQGDTDDSRCLKFASDTRVLATECLAEDYRRKVARYCAKKLALFYTTGFPHPPTIPHSEIGLGRLLGEGGFSSVYQVTNTDNIDDTIVLKMLRPKLVHNPSLMAACAVGLAKEGALLATLSHPHLLKGRGVAASCCNDTDGTANYQVTGRPDAYFILLDRLDTTLAHKLPIWKTRQQDLMRQKALWKTAWRKIKRNNNKSAHTSTSRLLSDLTQQRLQVALEIAQALAYLHAHGIVHRDVKPDNVGFDAKNGITKVFDLDVARVMNKNDRDDEQAVFHWTHKIGTRRYMSPECALGQPYNATTDTYSFGILLWQMLHLELPYSEFPTKELHISAVFQQGARPKVHYSKYIPDAALQLMQDCWSSTIADRPSMEQVVFALTTMRKEYDRMATNCDDNKVNPDGQQ